MAEENDPKALKEQRSKLRSKVTTAANSLNRKLKSTSNLSELEVDHQALHNAYDDFTVCQLIYEEIVSTEDGRYDSYKVVGGLDLAAYQTAVEEVYNSALQSYNSLQSRLANTVLTNESKPIVSKFKTVLNDLDELLSKSEAITDDNVASIRGILDETSVVTESIRGFSIRITPVLSLSELVDEMNSYVCELDVRSYKVRQLLHKRGRETTRTSTFENSSLAVHRPTSSNASLTSGSESDRAVDRPPVVSADVTGQPENISSVRAQVTGNGPISSYSLTDHTTPALSSPYNRASSVTSAYSSPIRSSTLHPIASRQTLTFGISGNAQVNALDNSTRAPPMQNQVSIHEQVHAQAPHEQFCNSKYTKFKKTPPPTFNGNRNEWPEFRAIWRKHGEREYPNDEERAWALKRSLNGRAAEHVKAIFATQPDAYARIWSRLDSIYSDVSHTVQDTFTKFSKLKPIAENDSNGMVNFANEIEMCYSSLGEIGHLDAVTLHQIDSLSDLLPAGARKLWRRIYRQLPQENKIHPFQPFMEFLEDERDDCLRTSEKGVPKAMQDNPKQSRKNTQSLHAQAQVETTSTIDKNNSNSKCAIHSQPHVTHATHECREFCKMTLSDKLDSLKKAKLCFRCFGKHKREHCKAQDSCRTCHKTNHHYLMCRSTAQNTNNYKHDQKSGSHKPNERNESQKPQVTASANKAAAGSSTSLLPIMQAKVSGTQTRATILFDGGSDCSYIREQSAKLIKAKRLGPVTLDVVTMGGCTTKYETHQYEISLVTPDGSSVKVIAYGMDRITGSVSRLNGEVIRNLFPYFDTSLLSRASETVDILLGNDYYGLHPKRELYKSGKHLSIMEGELGICLQGSHPHLAEATTVATNCSDAYNVSAVSKVTTNFANTKLRHFDMTSNIAVTKTSMSEVESFIQGEQLGTAINPKCGGCKCAKCPIIGHTYSFQEQQELDLIRTNLCYDEENKRWITKYPWIKDPDTLPDNYFSALATLKSCENTLSKDSQWAKVYNDQIQDMVERNVARKLTEEEANSWTGPKFYISHLAVNNPKSETTPVRIVFNSSQSYKGISLNSALGKGPDAYLNSLLGILLRWREDNTAFVGDIRKMFNSIYIEELEQHCHRFLWRNLDSNRDPDVYIIQRVNMGDKPAGAISSEAIYKTATLFENDYPQVAELLRHATYVDDIVDSTSSKESAIGLAKDTEEVLSKVGFRVKGWQVSGEAAPRTTADTPPADEKERHTTRVLGVVWHPKEDEISISSNLNFSSKKRGKHTEENLTAEKIPAAIPLKLTRRIVLEQVMKVYDPLGLVSPFTLQAKCMLRDTWTLGLKWDEPIPDELRTNWVSYFEQLIHLPDMTFKRYLKPSNAIGQPLLVIFSDGSEIAYGFAAYIRWKLADGSYFVRLICSKSRIAPMKKLSVPQMELNGAVMSKRARQLLERELRFSFEKVVHLIDSETVLHMLNGISTRFKMYEGVRLGEIQAATQGNMSSWFWVSGKENAADILTRPKSLAELTTNSEWWKGPYFLYTDEDTWNIRSSQSYANTNSTQSERVVLTATVKEAAKESRPLIEYTRFSKARKVVWTLARVLGALRSKSFKGGQTQHITTDILHQAEDVITKNVQSTMSDLKLSAKGKYKRLQPKLNSQGTWVVGRRWTVHNPFGLPHQQHLLPSDHWYTMLVMKEAHEAGHRGRDATLAQFRERHWTPHGSKLARKAKNDCQQCRVRDPKLLEQVMGPLPAERLKPSPPFNHVMVDLFGPFAIRGEVQKRTTGKAYGIMFTDLYSRAVHIEAAFGYDTQSFILALARFTAVRGWPEKLYSDPGSQLVGAEKELKEVWKRLRDDSLYKRALDNGTQWFFGPADSPWHQGAVESLIKSAKRCFKLAIGEQRVTSAEFLTLCSETANMLNERPIGVAPSDDSEITVLTPNCLLLGRTRAPNPGGWSTDHSFLSRLAVISGISDQFWKYWCELYAPTMVHQLKWCKSHRDLCPGDIVAVADQNHLRGRYHIARVSEVFPSKDGKVRRVSVTYKNFKQNEKVNIYKGANDTKVIRSVQRLALLVPVGGYHAGASEQGGSA